jgi:hypothetical protein
MISDLETTQHDRHIAASIKAACVRAALEAYERASADGLCAEGALEIALDAIRVLDIEATLEQEQSSR